ncbi:MAG: hypothetical protein MHM6MM_001868 [Cercozoa sp. M6MM]
MSSIVDALADVLPKESLPWQIGAQVHVHWTTVCSTASGHLPSWWNERVLENLHPRNPTFASLILLLLLVEQFLCALAAWFTELRGDSTAKAEHSESLEREALLATSDSVTTRRRARTTSGAGTNVEKRDSPPTEASKTDATSATSTGTLPGKLRTRKPRGNGAGTVTLNTFDILKITAVVAMIVDHIGFFQVFLPPSAFPWCRAIGRISGPLFYFLIGFSRNYDFRWKLWLTALSMVVSNTHFNLFVPIADTITNILLTRRVMKALPLHAMTRSVPNMCATLLVSAVVNSLYYGEVVDYGTTCFNFMLLGWMSRDISLRWSTRRLFWLTVVALDHGAHSVMVFGRDRQDLKEFICAFWAFAVSTMLLMRLVRVTTIKTNKKQKASRFKSALLAVAAFLVRVLSRETLPLYVTHMLLLKMEWLLQYHIYFVNQLYGGRQE